MDIEEVAKNDPTAIFTEPVSVTQGPTEEQLRTMAKNLKFEEKLVPEVIL